MHDLLISLAFVGMLLFPALTASFNRRLNEDAGESVDENESEGSSST